MNFQDVERLDQRWTTRLTLKGDHGLLSKAAAVFAHSGDSWFWLFGLAALAIFRTGFWRAWALQMILVVLVAAALVLGLKFTFRRRRPEGTWGDVYRRADPHSFPSGHAARAVLLAVLAGGWGPAWLVPVLLIWAPLVMLSRIALGVHYLSDIVAGALLGLLLGAAAILLIPPPM